MKRLDLKLYQEDVAKVIRVDTLTVCNRGNNLTTFQLRFLPKLFDLLGYNPLQSNATILGGKIKQYRIQKGLNLRRLAKELDIDPGTRARWERGECHPCRKHMEARDSNQFLIKNTSEKYRHQEKALRNSG